ncbi:hypothetical protein EUX98_g633 [Antrodiella citrinella]|uniref:DUF1740-domain-containing protein n=1 Tax=Antrodiella citrinella TaxID=2447956 RepID=A0A4S4NC13_9APHY|nr:hypothetical protein EUX98_g633 [Antrodiella citrinella]
MSGPSFSLFSFSTFPDLEPEASTSKAATETSKSKKDKHHRSEKKSSSRKHKEDGETSKDKEPRKKKKEKHSHSAKAYDLFEDERELRKRDGDTRSGRADDLSGVLEDKPLFYSDRKGDPLNVTYGGLHVYDVPRHFLVDRRHILGLPNCTVVSRERHQISVTVGGGGKRKNKHKYDEVEGFLRITTNRPHRSSNPSYRSVTAPDPNADSDASGSSSEGEEDGDSDYDSDTTPETYLQATLRSLEVQLAEKPEDISAWLSLLSHTLSAIPMSSKHATKARSDISLSVLSRALAAHPDNAKSKPLRLKYIKAGEQVWSEAQLRAEWETALELRDADLWMEWLDWRIRSASAGLEEGVVECALRMIAVFRSEDSEYSELTQLRILWRIAVAFRDSGYTERATAIFQAQAELIYNMPKNLTDLEFDEVLDELELFWESEVPRIGEPGATGWNIWDSSGRSQADAISEMNDSWKTTALSDKYESWAQSEMSNDTLLPSRSFHTADNIDPYVTVLFVDIRPVLVELHSQRARDAFRLVWLSFLGLDMPGFPATLSSDPAHSLDDKWALHLSSITCLDSIFPSSSQTRITADASAGVMIGREKEYSSSFGPVKNWTYGVFGPLEHVDDGSRGTSKRRQWGMWSDLRSVEKGIVRQVFEKCRLPTDDNADWDVLRVKFEAGVDSLDLKSTIKVSKSILAKAGSSLPRWAVHARLEYTRGKLDAARKVYETILSSAQHGHPDYSILWWEWADMEWASGNPDAAQTVIHRSVGAEGSGGIATLRTKRSLEDVIDRTSLFRWKEREAWTKCRALLDLLTSTPEAALTYLDTQLDGLRSGSLEHESLVVAALCLVYTHASVLKHPTPQALMRDRAEKAIEDYPNNTIILGFFLESERGQGVWGRVRAMLGEGRGKEKDVARRVAEVWVAGWEPSRWEAEQERTRHGLSAAVEDERTRGSATLWRIYIEFEIRCGELQRAKKLLFRAVGACPLVKELYLLAFVQLRSVFSGRELQDWVEVMVERGVRMRRSLDEEVDEDGDKVDMKVKGEMDEEDEIEHNARELRRLQPY